MLDMIQIHENYNYMCLTWLTLNPFRIIMYFIFENLFRFLELINFILKNHLSVICKKKKLEYFIKYTLIIKIGKSIKQKPLLESNLWV